MEKIDELKTGNNMLLSIANKMKQIRNSWKKDLELLKKQSQNHTLDQIRNIKGLL